MLTRSAEHVLHTLMTHTLSPFPVPWAGIKEWTSGLSEYFHSNCTVDQKKQAVSLQRKKFFYEQLQTQSNWKPQMQNNYYSFLPPTRNNMNFCFMLETSLTITVLLYCNTEKKSHNYQYKLFKFICTIHCEKDTNDDLTTELNNSRKWIFKER